MSTRSANAVRTRRNHPAWVGRLAMIVVIVACGAAGVRAQGGGEAAGRTLDARLKALRAEAATLEGQQKTLLGRLRQLQVARETRRLELEQTNTALARVAADVDAARARVASADAAVRAAQPEIRERLVRMYKLLPIGYDRLLLSIARARSLQRAARVASVVARGDRARLESFLTLRRTRAADVARLQRQQETLAALRTRLVQEEAAFAEATAAQAALLRATRERRDVNEQLVAELTAARDRLDRSVGGLGSSATAYTRPGAASATAAMAGLGTRRGAIEWPLAGALAARFGREASSRFGTVIVRNGVEIRATPGSPVRAVEAGRVAFADTFSGFGLVVIVDHGQKCYSLYGHLASLDVSKGARVEAGRTVGTVGTGPTGDASLYFELRVDGRPVDPLQWLKKRP